MPESMSADKGAYYLFHEDRLVENFQAMDKAFRSRYGNFQIAYSFKTNYLRKIIDCLIDLGCFSEVVSPYELQYAGINDYRPSTRVIYNGVIPDPAKKHFVALHGGIVNVDNYDEYISISKIAAKEKTIIPLGVRVNFDVGNDLVSRFGVDIDSPVFKEIMDRIAADPYVIFSGFHCHIGTARPAEYWEKKARKMAELASIYKAVYVDLGGGMYGPMIDELASQFPGYVNSFDEYAERVCAIMKSAFPDERVRLIVEPGTALVGNTFDLVAHVTNIKNVRGRTYITVDTCSNHLGMICECRKIPVKNVHDATGPRHPVKDAYIVGCTCLEFDYIRKEYNDCIAVGDTLIFENVGAYSLSAARQFIVPRIPVYDKKTGQELQKAETAFDMFKECFP